MARGFILLLFVCLSVSTYSQNKFVSHELTGAQACAVWPGAEHVWLKQENTIPAFIQFRKGSEPDEEGFFIVLHKLYQLPDSYGFRLIGSEKDELAWEHKRYQLTLNGIPVANGIFLLHLKNGKVKKYNGYLFKNVSTASAPSVTESAALGYALANIDATLYKWQVPGENEFLKQQTGDSLITYFPKGTLEIVQIGRNESNVFRLAWKFDIYAQAPLSRNDVYVDALTGDILRKNATLYSANTGGTAVTAYRGVRSIIADSYSGQYRLKETTRGKGIHTYNMRTGVNYNSSVEFLDADNYWNNVNANLDQYAGDAHWGAEMTYDFYTAMGRNSIDNAGYALNLFVHYDVNYVNAFWDSREMNFGDGDGVNYKPLTSLDVTGHEISHGLDQYTANLTYQNESGALNESFSDIMGTSVEWFADSTKGNWTIGEDLGPPFRDMSNPKSTNDPDTYFGVNWYSGLDDNGGVHTNSNVQNYWYYLLAHGGSGINDNFQSYNVPGISRYKATRIAWRNLVTYLTASADYADARFYSQQSAIDLYGTCSPELISTTKAWYAVGVGADFVYGVTAQFSATPLIGCTIPTDVTFTNTSFNAFSYKWDFGDGTTSTLQDPVHTYTSYQKYTVKLSVNGGSCGVDSITKTNYININSSNSCMVILPQSGSYQTQTACAGTLYDDGGPSHNYSDLTSSQVTITPTGASKVMLHFSQFRMENNYDYLYVYDGASTNSPLLASFTGYSIPADITSSGSSITIRQFSDNYVHDTGFAIQWTCIAPTAPPTAAFVADITQSCTGIIHFTNLTSGGASSFLWNFGDGTTSILENPVHQYFTDSVFTVSLTSTNSYGANTATKIRYITVNRPAAPSAANVSHCGPSTFALQAGVTDPVTWFDSSGTIVSTSNPFNTPVLSTTQTYWVEDSVSQPIYNVGPVNNSIGNGDTLRNPWALIFNVYKYCKLLSVFIYAQGAGYRTFQYLDSSGAVIQQQTINCPNGANRITLNFDLVPGGPYQLKAIGNNNIMYRNNSGASYPYKDADGMVSIIGNSAPNVPKYYYYFYDWEVQEQNCISLRQPVTAFVKPAISADVPTVKAPTCYGGNNGSAIASVFGGTPSISYNWSSGQTGSSVSNLKAGALTVTVTDAAGCSATATNIISQPDSLDLVANITNVSCNGGTSGTISLVVSGGAPGYTYNWGNNITTQNRTGLSAATYMVTITDKLGCSASATETVFQPFPVNISVSKTDATCGSSNGTATAIGSGGTAGYSYSWNSHQTSSAINNISAGNYIVTVTDSHNCTATSSVIVNNSGSFTAAFQAVNTSCFGKSDGSIHLTVNGGNPPFAYSWGNNNTTDSIAHLAAGTYNVTVTDHTPCTNIFSQTITQPTAINISVTTVNTICNLNNGNATAQASGGVPTYKYKWSSGDTVAAIIKLPAANYSVTVTDNSGCTSTTSASIKYSSSLVTEVIASDASCFGRNDGAAHIIVHTGTHPFSFLWSNGGTDSLITGQPAGNYYVIVTDSDNCHGIDSFVIDQPLPMLVDLNIQAPSCNQYSDGSAYAVPSGGNSSYSFLWSDSSINNDLQNLKAGKYALTVSDGNGCMVDSSFSLADPPLLTIYYSIKNISCYGLQDGRIIITTVGGVSPYNYFWNNGTTSDTLTSLAIGSYSLTVTDKHNCLVNAVIPVDQPDQLYLIPSVINNSTGQNSGSASVQMNGGVPPYTFAWNTTDTSQTISKLPAGSYTVTVTDHNGCQQTATILITGATGLNEISGDLAFHIYPNPASIEAILELNQLLHETSFTLMDITGRVLNTMMIVDPKTMLDLSHLAAGMYIVEVKQGNQKAVRQLAISR